MSADLINLVDRPTYGLLQVDRVLGLPSGTARRWIDGYTRGGKSYPPVIREHPTGDEIATWGEFVETRLLAEFRDAGVPMIRMRPAVDVLREQLNTAYPLASSRAWLDTEGKELVRKVQERVGLERRLALVVVRSGQSVLRWSKPAEDFRSSVEWTSGTRAMRSRGSFVRFMISPTSRSIRFAGSVSRWFAGFGPRSSPSSFALARPRTP